MNAGPEVLLWFALTLVDCSDGLSFVERKCGESVTDESRSSQALVAVTFLQDTSLSCQPEVTSGFVPLIDDMVDSRDSLPSSAVLSCR